ncbi:hypothetical protein BCR43DRAFT_488639 [Syncephalastrum racemosum]|uniref:Uncharacterized protein n=1 Tax=Syncephalastrum racemosum TaxID=13706 RepID=A0A1X2HJ05_SYNRA|nr:hypothetical protein BCR43DRAFT_488639 [Syncephalastrum racemosum]
MAPVPEDAAAFPTWSIIVIVILVIVLCIVIGLAVWIVRRRLSRPPTVDIGDSNHHVDLEKQQPQDYFHNVPTLPAQSPPRTSPSDGTHPSAPPPTRRTSTPKREKISLPLPPPSTSLFSDKMELSSDEAMELFDKYMNAGLEEKQQGGLTANLQHKAATFRSTLRQSLRRQKSTKNNNTTLDQIFQQPSEVRQSTVTTSSMSGRSAMSSSSNSRKASMSRDEPPPTPRREFDSSPPPPLPPVPREPNPIPAASQTPQLAGPIQETQDKEEVQPAAPASAAPVDAANAARRVIRTASRKSKSRSMIVNEDDVMKMFGNPDETSPPLKNVNTITSGSVRRLVRDSIVTDKSASVSAARARRQSQNPSAADIAGWWQQQQQSSPPPQQPPPPTPSVATAEHSTMRSVRPSERPAAADLFTQENEEEQPKKQNVDTVRRMLQATWHANMRESPSMASIVSDGTVQNIPTVGKARPSVRQLQQRFNESQQGGPEPSASFSSSTVRTMIPDEPPSNPAAQEKIEIDGTNFSLLPNASGYQTWNEKLLANQANKKDSSRFNTINVGRSQKRSIPWMNEQQ